MPESIEFHPETDLESVRLALYHIHLPKLVDAEVIEWDQDQNQLFKRPNFKTATDLFVQSNETSDDI